jgi:hypothetical protein
MAFGNARAVELTATALVVASVKLALPLPDVATGSVTVPLYPPAIVERLAVCTDAPALTTADEIAGSVGVTAGAGVGVVTLGAEPPPPPPPQAQSSATKANAHAVGNSRTGGTIPNRGVFPCRTK